MWFCLRNCYLQSSKGCNSKSINTRVMVLAFCMSSNVDWYLYEVSWWYLERFLSSERTRPYRKIYYFQFQRAITPKICNPELRFLCSAHHLMLLYICIKFYENISNSFGVTEQTWFCDRQNRRPGQKQDVSQPYGGRLNEPSHEIMVLFVLRKLILQTCMRSHPVGLDVLIFDGTLGLHPYVVCEQRRLWRDCGHVQACQSLGWSPMWYVP